MTPKSKNILVGIFVIVLSLGLISFVTWLGGSAVREETNTYLSYLDEAVSGLSQNSPVKYKGVTIGIVEGIRINPNNSNQVELRLQIQQGTPIKVDSKLILTSQGITGLQYIEITGGSEKAALLISDAENKTPIIPTGKSTLATLEAAIGPMLGNINLTIEEIRKILIHTKTENLSLILSDVQKITGMVAQKSDPFFNDITEASANLKQITNQTEKLVENVNQFLINPDSQFVTLLKKMNQSTDTFNQLLKDIERKQLVAETGKTLKNVNRLTNNLNRKMEGQWDELIVELNHSLQSMNQLLDQMAEKEIVQNVDNVISQVDRLLQKVQTTSQTMNQLLNEISDREIVQNTSKTINQASQLVSNANNTILGLDKYFEKTSQTISKADTFLENLQQTPEDVNQLLEKLTQTANSIDSITASLNKQIHSPEFQNLSGEFSNTLQTTNKMSHSLNQIIQEADISNVIEELTITLQEIQELSERWSRVGESLENNPSSFFFGDSKNEIKLSQ